MMQRWNSYADAFVLLFGGEAALDRRQENQAKVDSKTSASPMSGTVGKKEQV